MADLRIDLAELPVARRAAIEQVLAEALCAERELAALYGEFAAMTRLRPLGTALAELADAKRRHVAALGASAATVAADAGAPATAPPVAAVDAPLEQRSELFARAFRAERRVAQSYRELATLLGWAAEPPTLGQLTREAAEHRARLRTLYVRYS